MGAHQAVLEVQLRSREEIEAHRVHQHFRAALLDDEVIRVLRLREIEFILQAGAAACQHLHPKRLRAGLAGQDFRHAVSGIGRDGKAHAAYIARQGLGGKGRLR